MSSVTKGGHGLSFNAFNRRHANASIWEHGYEVSIVMGKECALPWPPPTSISSLAYIIASSSAFLSSSSVSFSGL